MSTVTFKSVWAWPRGERYLTLPEIAERLKVSRRTVYRWVKDGDLNVYKFANEYRITESDLKDFLERRRTGRN